MKAKFISKPKGAAHSSDHALRSGQGRVPDIDTEVRRLAKERQRDINCGWIANLGEVLERGYPMIFMQKPRVFQMHMRKLLKGSLVSNAARHKACPQWPLLPFSFTSHRINDNWVFQNFVRTARQIHSVDIHGIEADNTTCTVGLDWYYPVTIPLMTCLHETISR